MNAAGWIFKGAGVCGLVALLPLYFLEDLISRELPPTITHPEFYYAFVGVAVAWQVAFLIIGSDPGRHRQLMPAAVIEKASVSAALLSLWMKGRIPTMVALPGLFDGLLGGLFVIAWIQAGVPARDSEAERPG